MPPLILAIDTAFSRCLAAVFDPADGGRLLAAREPEIGKGHAERLTRVIDDVLGEAGATYRDLSRVVVTTGPGSFTGIRVGVAAARGLALALDIPAVGISTLQALAHRAINGAINGRSETGDDMASAPILAALDARRGEIYAALFSAGGSVLGDPVALQPAALDAMLNDAGSTGPVRLVGSGAEIAAANLAGRSIAIVSAADRIDPETLARLGSNAAVGKPPSPLYLRSADAKPSSAASLRAGHVESIP